MCHESGFHSLQLHITHGLHLPSCTAHTLSRPPLHQSHSCHHSLINSDCLTTPAPHSLTHIKAAHKHSPSAKSCLLPALLTPPAYWLSSLSAACPDPLLCHRSRICLLYVALDTTVWYLPVWPPLCFNKAASGSNYTASSLQKTSPPQIQRLYFGYPA